VSDIVMMVGEGEYRSHETMRLVCEDAERELGASVAYSTPNVLEDVPTFPRHSFAGLDALEKARVLVIYTRFRQLPDQQMQQLADFLNRGGAVVGLRTSTHAFHYPSESVWATWNDGFGRDILGTPWVSHHGHTSRTMVRRLPRVEHAVLEGVGPDFMSRSWLYRTHLSTDSVRLLGGEPIEAENAPTPGPVAWIRTHPGGGRVFYTSLGHADDFEIPQFRRLLSNAIRWCASTDVESCDGRSQNQ
jgi:type 1 glutamine amidotransferase